MTFAIMRLLNNYETLFMILNIMSRYNYSNTYNICMCLYRTHIVCRYRTVTLQFVLIRIFVDFTYYYVDYVRQTRLDYADT